MDVMGTIEKIVAKTNKKTEELENELNDEFNKLDPSISEKDRKSMAFSRFRASYRKILSSKGEEVEIVFIGATNALDMVKKRRATAQAIVDKNPETAIKEGMVNKEGELLYYIPQDKFEKLQGWKIKQDYIQSEEGTLIDKTGIKWIGKVIPKEDFQKTAFGAVKFESGKIIPAIVSFRKENSKIPIPMFKWTKVDVFKKQTSSETLLLFNDSGTTEFKNETELKEDEILSLFETTFKKYNLVLGSYKEWCESHSNFNDFAIMKVVVNEILLPTGRLTNSMLRVDDDTMEFDDEEGNIIPPYACFLSEHIKIDFPEKAEIWMIGKPGTNDRGSTIAVSGIYSKEVYRNLSMSKEEKEQWE